jgi:hypothetical protein
MAKCWLKGTLGDALNTVLSAAGYNVVPAKLLKPLQPLAKRQFSVP